MFFFNFNLLAQAQWEREGSSMITDKKTVNIKGKSGSGLDVSFATPRSETTSWMG
jgi:hypothetical protein